MDSARWERIQSVFLQAAELPPDGQREFLAVECAGDAALYEVVVDMLAHDAQQASVLDRDLAEAAHSIVTSPEAIADLRFGPYRVLRILGEGGAGVVYLAVRDDLASLAAIKVLRDAWLSPARRERFGREQRILAQLNYPLIARLYDADTLPDGTPWFAMEYVEGVPLTEYCRDRGASLDERLRLFADVCEAVQYAHQQLVVHQDLKPSNILVTHEGRVKLLDFGISKQLDAPSGVAAPVAGVRLMTLAYAAPEQVRDAPVGVQTDVYALGAILYELLTGRTPFDVSHETPGEAERVIVESDLRRPSLAAPAAARRATASHAWADLDAMCLRAMRKDPHQRYGSVEAFRRDVEHYLRQQPLEARPGELRYRTAKFLRRNNRRVAAAAAALIAIVALVTYYTARLTTARNAAVAEAVRTERIQRFMLTLFDGGDKDAGPATDLRVVTLLDRGLVQARALDREPLVQAELYQTLGGIYRKFGQLDRADTLLQASLDARRSLRGAAPAEIVKALVALAALRSDQARFDEAERLAREALALARQPAAFSDPIVATANAALGAVLEQRGKYDEAIVALDEAVRLRAGPDGDQRELAASLVELAGAHFYAGHYDRAESLNQRTLALHRQLYGDRHPLVAEDLINLGAVEHERGRYQEAERQYRDALDINQSWYGKDNGVTASNLTMLGRTLVFQRRFDEADALLRQALAIQERVFGASHPRVASALNDLGNVAMKRDQPDDAERFYRRNLAIYRSVYGDTHFLVGVATSNLAGVFMARRDYAAAERLYRDAVALFGATQSPDHLNTGIARIKLGQCLLRQRRYADAEKESFAGYTIVSKKSAPTVSWLRSARDDLAAIYQALGETGKAAAMRTEAARFDKTP